MVIRAKVTKGDGNNLDAGKKVGIVNNFLHSLFKQFDVFFKEKQVTQRQERMPIVPTWKRSWTTILHAAKRSQLTAAMLYKDTTGKMDIADPSAVVANANLGLKERYVFSRESGILEITGQLFCDVFRSERLLLSFVDLKVIKVKVSPSISIAHELSMKKDRPSIPWDAWSAKLLSLRQEISRWEKITSITGSYRKRSRSEWSTVQHSTESTSKILTILKPIPPPSWAPRVNGEEVPFKPQQLSYAAANPRYTEAYLAMFSGTGKLFYDSGISRSDFANGYGLYVADLTPDMCGSFDNFNAV